MSREKKIIFSLDAENSRLKKKLEDVNQKLDQSKKKTSGLKGVWKKAFAGIAALVGGAVLALKEMIGVLSDLDKGMRNVNSILGLSEEKFKSLENEVLQVQSDLGISSKELTEALYQAVSAGVDAADAIAFLKQAGEVGIGGVASTTEAVDILTTVLNAFHLEASETSRVSDILFQTIKLGKTNMAELSESMSQVAPIAAANGIAFDEASAAIASLTKQGTPTSQAITQIRSSIVSMNKVLGDGWAETMSYQEAVAEVAKQAGGSNNKLKEMLGRIEAVNAVLGLTGENAQTAADDLDAMRNSLGAASDALDEQSKSIERRWNKFTAGFIVATTKVTNAILDMLLPVQDLNNLTTQEFEKLQKSTTDTVKNLAGLVRKYDDLKKIQTPTKEEQKKLNKTIQDIAEIVPGSVSVIDEYGTALDINKASITNFIDAQRELIKRTHADVYGSLKDDLKDTISDIDTARSEISLYNENIDRLNQLKEKGQKVEIIGTGTHTQIVTVSGSIDEMNSKIIHQQSAAQDASKSLDGMVLALSNFINLENSTPEKLSAELDISNDKAQKLIERFKKLNEVVTPKNKNPIIDSKKQQEAEVEVIKSIERIGIATKEFQEVSEVAFGESSDAAKEYARTVDDEIKRMKQLFGALGQSFAQGVDQGGLKEGLKQILITYIQYLEYLVTAGKAASVLKSIFGDISGYAQVFIATGILEALKIGISSFRTGVSDLKGGTVADIHKDERVFLPQGSTVKTSVQASRLDNEAAKQTELLKQMLVAIQSLPIPSFKIGSREAYHIMRLSTKNLMGKRK